MPRLPRTRLPRIHAEIMITGRSPEFGQSLSLGVHDLTKTIVFAITGNPDWQKPRQLLPLPRAISLYDLSRSLDTTTIDTIEALRQTSGTINIPGLREQTNDFINRCGGPNGIIAYRRRLNETEQLEWRIRSASKELKALRNATFKPDIHAVDYVCMDEAFMATDDTLFDEWGYDEYRKNHPPPRLGAPEKLYERWARRYSKWVEKNAPPWVWSTTKIVWGGLSASEIREQAANGSCNHGFDLDAMMEHEFTEFHDEALD